MGDLTNNKTPKVFISYSHDSPSHKKWVSEFSSKLVENGIDVIIDQWDLGPGDNVPKFMENSVRVADRVLMICSEKYVKKADEREGGVGYEAMVVTGELIRDLGTSKFIPIVRQRLSKPTLPISINTRFYINLSKKENFEEQFETLLRELHQMPAESKPPLGKNPFEEKTSRDEPPDYKRKINNDSIKHIEDMLISQKWNHAMDAISRSEVSDSTILYDCILKISSSVSEIKELDGETINIIASRLLELKNTEWEPLASALSKCITDEFFAYYNRTIPNGLFSLSTSPQRNLNSRELALLNIVKTSNDRL